MNRTSRLILILAVLGALALPVPAMASLTVFNTYTGNVAVSTDGFGSTTQSGTISADVPAGATVLAAYLYSSTFNIVTNTPQLPGGTLGGTPVSYGPVSANVILPTFVLASARADVTSIVGPVINGGPGGIYNFAVTETNAAQDGEALVVVYSLASLASATVGILDGFSAVDGDVTSITFAGPLDPNDPAFFAEMRLGIGFSAGGIQSSRVSVNGTVITESAGAADDGAAANGALMTVGGIGDAFSPPLPSVADDHERYDLVPYITAGDTSIVVNTLNPSRDDNIFLATFYVSGEADIVTDPVPEPGTMTLLGLGLAGLLGRRRLRR